MRINPNILTLMLVCLPCLQSLDSWAANPLTCEQELRQKAAAIAQFVEANRASHGERWTFSGSETGAMRAIATELPIKLLDFFNLPRGSKFELDLDANGKVLGLFVRFSVRPRSSAPIEERLCSMLNSSTTGDPPLGLLQSSGLFGPPAPTHQNTWNTAAPANDASMFESNRTDLSDEEIQAQVREQLRAALKKEFKEELAALKGFFKRFFAGVRNEVREFFAELFGVSPEPQGPPTPNPPPSSPPRDWNYSLTAQLRAKAKIDPGDLEGSTVALKLKFLKIDSPDRGFELDANLLSTARYDELDHYGAGLEISMNEGPNGGIYRLGLEWRHNPDTHRDEYRFGFTASR